MAESAYTINGDGIAHEVLEGEAILINFKTGSYYSLDGVGEMVWEYLCRGPATASTLTTALSATLSTDPDTLRSALERFLEELREEELVALTDLPISPIAPRPVSSAQAFTPPVLGKYTDLEALLLLDPIHDVVVTGWPNAKPNRS